MAGMAISPLLKIKGDEAIAMACAAFCMLTSIIIVRRTALFVPARRERMELHSIAKRISKPVARPTIVKLSIISCVY